MTINIPRVTHAIVNKDSTVTLTITIKALEQIVYAFQSHQDEGIRFSGISLFSVLCDCKKQIEQGERE